jgi:hypothetical protein
MKLYKFGPPWDEEEGNSWTLQLHAFLLNAFEALSSRTIPEHREYGDSEVSDEYEICERHLTLERRKKENPGNATKERDPRMGRATPRKLWPKANAQLGARSQNGIA